MPDYFNMLWFGIGTFYLGVISLQRGRGGAMTKRGLVLVLFAITSFVAFGQELLSDIALRWQTRMGRLSLLGEALLNQVNLVVTSSPPFYFLGFGVGVVLLVGSAVFTYFYVRK
jgi:hypothetical protein